MRHPPGPHDHGLYNRGVPETSTRYRCSACGNLTRFDVVVTRRTRAFHHYTVGGDLEVEDEEIIDEVLEEITCRWCGTGTSVVELSGDAEAATAGDQGAAS